ncbi:histidine kinase [Algoriphagus sp. H41]|uniref:Histidine kinase n=1 Tax=Algoriphagus oliviformis TaxID=2811231 RepID=A0ABS3C7J2_9BACT|nr:histidine kinase [Algoriphagus oliviformis]MBN7813094.1 histidine kinase [Algoriphagus oliviformis]
MRPFIERPILILAVPWIVYPTVDIISTVYLKLESNGIPFALVTTVIGFLTSCIYFFWLIPSFFYSKRTLFIAGISMASIAVLALTKYVMFWATGIVDYAFGDFVVYELMRQLVFFPVTMTVWAVYMLIRALQEKHKTEIRLDKLSIDYRNARLSPHFMLNLIGDISTKSLRYSPELFEDLNHFITILRYAYLDTDKFNSLASEVEALQSYLHGQKVRFEESFCFQEDIDASLLEKDELYMPKLLLITLIENVFKHGIFQDADYPVIISAGIAHDDSALQVFCFSTTNKVGKTPPLEKSGFGIDTVRNIIDYFFPNAELNTASNGAVFSLNLTIPYATPNQTWPDR